jgi:hypothetical protein
MNIYVSVGEWMSSIQSRMSSAVDGDCFCLPTPMHLHAYELVKETSFPARHFKVEIKEEQQV